MSRDGTISARLILRGTTPSVCKGCELFSDVMSLS